MHTSHAVTPSSVCRELETSCPDWPDAGSRLVEVVDRLQAMVDADGILWTCGNGGSAADSSHVVGELVKSFRIPRPLSAGHRDAFTQAFGEAGTAAASRLESGVRAVSLACSAPAMTAIANDCGPDLVFAQQVWALARRGDVVWALSTSGNSENVIQSLRAARVRQAGVIGLCGSADCKMDGLCDILVKVPATETYRVQEYHLAFYHAVCATLEARVFGTHQA